MPSTRDIRRRIKSVKNTAQITKAMQMVAASKMRKAQQAALAGRPYAQLMNKVLAARGRRRRARISHPFLEQREGGAALRGSDQHGQGIVRRAEQQPDAGSGEVRAGHGLDGGGAERLAISGADQRRLVAEFTYKDAPLFGRPRDFQICVRPFSEGGSEPCGHPVHEFHLDAGAEAGNAPAVARRRN